MHKTWRTKLTFRDGGSVGAGETGGRHKVQHTNKTTGETVGWKRGRRLEVRILNWIENCCRRRGKTGADFKLTNQSTSQVLKSEKRMRIAFLSPAPSLPEHQFKAQTHVRRRRDSTLTLTGDPRVLSRPFAATVSG